MKRVSKKEYDSAVLTVRSYHDQIEESLVLGDAVSKFENTPVIKFLAFNNTCAILPNSEFDLNNVKTGDFLIAAKTNSKRISAGKSYKVIEAVGSAIKLIDDGGSIKYLSRENKFKLWLVVT